MSKKVIAVVGATGAQGGGLVDAILGDRNSQYSVRALTRDPKSDKAQQLARRGAEVVAASVDDVDSLIAAFRGAHAAYCVTFFWEHFSPEKERAQARGMAQAAREARVSHAIWSTFEDPRLWVGLDDARIPTLAGKHKVPHFEGKAEANQDFLDLGVPVTFMLTSFYWDNLIQSGMGPKRGTDGKLGFVLPMADKKLPGIAAGDIGHCAYGIFQRGTEYIGKTVGVAGEHLTGSAMAATLGRVLGEEVVYQYVPPEIYRTFGFPGAEDLANMFQFKRDFEADYCGVRDVARSRQFYPGLQTFEQWLTANKARLPIG